MKNLIKSWVKFFNSFFYTGIKERKWTNVHSEIETTAGGGWVASGEEHLFEFESRCFYFLGLPIFRISLKITDKGIYNYEI